MNDEFIGIKKASRTNLEGLPQIKEEMLNGIIFGWAFFCYNTVEANLLSLPKKS